jgi:predicted nuclease with TOPRIM domain
MHREDVEAADENMSWQKCSLTTESFPVKDIQERLKQLKVSGSPLEKKMRLLNSRQKQLSTLLDDLVDSEGPKILNEPSHNSKFFMSKILGSATIT